MEFIINWQDETFFFTEDKTFSGVAKIAKKVMKDIESVTGTLPIETYLKEKLGKYTVIYGTFGNSPVLDELSASGIINTKKISGKRECYIFTLVEKPFPGVDCALVIAGSDKRGTIYGLFHLSEIIGVSPLVNWSDVKPAEKRQIILTEKDNIVSREPSVKFRGFFINDEWPAFGTWATKRFGGLNAKMYDFVFELLLRLKGNYLWPAMWASVFSDDGPGLESAELANEYGVIMGMSHHEPCLRHGEEYKRLRGKDSIYGDAWNFRSNREGIKQFWEDGLKRSAGFENVITVGMRGEQDSAIMGKEATMAENIELLRDVLKTQNKMIKEIAEPLHESVPKMIALYKEVEAYFYGNEENKGLIGSKELEDVILMFSDDNFGNHRTLPTNDMRNHKGGFGIYYHFDYHGWPISYEWVNSSYLPKVWEQMTTAYEYGVKDLWIVNVGDICTNEFPLSYFLDLAYDYDKWGINAIDKTNLYTEDWVKKQFAAYINKEQCEKITFIINEYTRIAHMRRPESMNSEIYHPFHYNEADSMLKRIETVISYADELKKVIAEEIKTAFFQQVYMPAVGNMNLQKLQILAGKNMAFAKQGRIEANLLVKQIDECLTIDSELESELHTIGNGKWYGMGLSEHIGFNQWNEEECRYPLQVKFKPSKKPRVIVSIPGTSQYTHGGSWTGKTLYINNFQRPEQKDAFFDISCGSTAPVYYKITSSPCIILSSYAGFVKVNDRIKVTLDRSKIVSNLDAEIIISSGNSIIKIVVQLDSLITTDESMVFYEANGYISIEAEHYYSKKDSLEGLFKCLPFHGKTLSAMKPFPVNISFIPGKTSPVLEYKFLAKNDGKYCTTLYMSPSNPVSKTDRISFAIQINGGQIIKYYTIPTNFEVGDHQEYWSKGVLSNIRTFSFDIICKKGKNTLNIYAVSPGFVLEKIVLNSINNEILNSYLGPDESFFIKRK